MNKKNNNIMLYRVVPGLDQGKLGDEQEDRNNGYGAAPASRHVGNAASCEEAGGKKSAKDVSDSDKLEDEDCTSLAISWCSQTAGEICSKKQLYKRLPILDWLPKYTVQTGIADFIAGITVGLTVIPQGIAYALVAGLPPQYGLYSAFMGCFIYTIFGSCKDITVGPTAIMSLLTGERASISVDFAILAAFLSGIVILVLGVLQLGFVIDFISVPVTAGFTSAAAITIASGQLKSLFGLEIEEETHQEGIVGTYIEFFSNIKSIRYQDTILGLVCLVILLLMRAMKNTKWFDSIEETEHPSRVQVFFNRFSPHTRLVLDKCIWVVSTARNAVVVVICLGIAYGFDPVIPEDPRNATFILTGDIDGGLPPFEVPPFSTVDNSTTPPTELDFMDMLSELGSGIIILPLIAILENVAIAKAFAGGKPVDASQEMIALGVCNIFGSFVGSYTTTGSFSRTAVNAASGVRTPMGGIYTGTLVILALAVLMEYCAYIPKATLAAVIITAVIFSVEYEVVKPIWRSKKTDLIVGLISFVCCLFWALEYGILVGVGVEVLLVLYNTARPRITVQREQLAGLGTEYLVVSIDRSLVFPSVNYVRNIVNKAGLKEGGSRMPVVVDCSHIYTTDFTAATGFKAMVTDFKRRGQPVIFSNMKRTVERVFSGQQSNDIVIVPMGEDVSSALHEIFANEDVEAGTVGMQADAESSPATVDPLLVKPPQAISSAQEKDDSRDGDVDVAAAITDIDADTNTVVNRRHVGGGDSNNRIV